MESYVPGAVDGAFERSRGLFGSIVAGLEHPLAGAVTHAELEDRLAMAGRELMRSLVQDHLDLRAVREVRRAPITDADGVVHTRVEAGHTRALITVFGRVRVQRLAYRAPGAVNLYPADRVLNLPVEAHSHGLRRLVAAEAVRGSFQGAGAAIARGVGVGVGKRQVEALARAGAVDLDAFYALRRPVPGSDGTLLVMQFDGKGVVMRPEALREATARAASQSRHKLATRLSRGEKPHRKRMAEVAAVYDAAPAPRGVEDIIAVPGRCAPGVRAPGPVVSGKWLTASVVEAIPAMIAAGFDEAQRRDPAHARRWVVLVDGNKQQINRIRAEAQRRKVAVTIVIDFIHVLEYVWRAAWCFYTEGEKAAEVWVAQHARRILAGHAGIVAAAIRRKATANHLTAAQRKNADTAAAYLMNKRRYLRYDQALASGWPIATGVIEGACRYLVKDRMDITGARWGLAGAEAVLKLRALISNGDFEAYWAFHLQQEQQRVHHTRYRDNLTLAA